MNLLLTKEKAEIVYRKDAPTNPRGIPYAPFVDKVEDYVSSRAEVDGTMKSFQEMISSVSILRLHAVLLLISCVSTGSINSWKSTLSDGREA